MTMVIDYAALTADERATIERLVAGQTTLQHVLRDFGAGSLFDIVTQDEYTHDLLVPHGAVWLNYDAT